MVLLRSSAFALVLAGLVQAAAVKRQDVSPLLPPQIASYDRFTYFASAAYCNPSTTMNWSCGANCQPNSDFEPTASGGDGDAIQFWYVGYSPSINTVIVAHQGTEKSKFLADLTDFRIYRRELDSSLFPGIPSSVKVHDGFANEQAKTASEILDAVKKTLSAKGAPTITVVGHSLGAALALLDGVYLKVQLGSSVNVQVVGYGMPRVGNREFADWVDHNLAVDGNLDGLVTHITHKKDPIPIVPGKILGFHHVSGEVHITESGTWENCPGQDNGSNMCSVGDVTEVYHGTVSDHDGPYNGIMIGCSAH